MPRDNSAPAAIDVWDVQTFDAELLSFLEPEAELIRGYFDTEHAIFLSHDLGRGPARSMMRPENPHAAMFYALVDSVDSLMAARAIRAFHYTRLVDDEVAALLRSGIHLSTPETLRRRLDGLVASGFVTTEIADRL